MTSWLAPYFLNPTAAAVGVGLVSVPVLIHLLNRMRFRRVEFAAMEFLLQSETQNRRRVLIEQLLLLAMRVLLVLLATLLIGRLILDASQVALFRGARTHDVVLLDDSLSTRDQTGERTAFDAGKEVVDRLASFAAAGGRRKLTVLRLSRPDDPLLGLSERPVDPALADELPAVLESVEPTHQAPDWAPAFEAIRDRLSASPNGVAVVHVASDFRKRDWQDAAAVSELLEGIEKAGARVNLVRTAARAQPNLVVSELRATAAAAAAGVPLRMRAVVRNAGPEPSARERLTVEVDGRPLPLNVELEPIEPGETAVRTFDVVLDDPGVHEVAAAIDADAIDADNRRTVAVDVPNENPVLLVDASPSGADAQYLADALAADRELTGYAPLIIGPDELRRTNLETYPSIYLVNVGSLANDLAMSLAEYVSGGGGLVWFAGERTRSLDSAGLGPARHGLLPGQLADAPADLADAPEPDIVAKDHPIFRVLAGTENPFLDQVRVARFHPLEGPPSDDADVLATARTGEPLVLEHRLGAGRVVTVLTSASPRADGGGTVWTNWPRSPSFPVFVLELQGHVSRRAAGHEQLAGEAIAVELDPASYREDVEVIPPDGPPVSLRAARGETSTLSAGYAETDRPGVYRLRLHPQIGEAETRLVSVNVDPDESRTALVSDGRLREQLSTLETLTIQKPGDFGWVGEGGTGSDLRLWLVGALLLLLCAEQALAYRLSYHPVG